MSVPYIDNPADLAAYCTELRRHDWFALDTEFMREKSYYPQLCLIQIATPDGAVCIDPFGIDDLGPLLDLLYDPAILKVLHAARQDLEIFHVMRGTPPAPVFDTQLAATLLGHGDQIGYGALVKETLGVELEKAHSRADWSLRPLTPEQLEYAADDVRYLVQVYQKQRAALEQNGRLPWLAEDFAALSDAHTYDNPPQEAWRRIKGVNFLKGVQLAVLQQLAAWREQVAQDSDRPRRWVLKDEVMFDMAKLMPDSLDKLGRIRGLEKGILERNGQRLLELIQQGRKMPQDDWPQLEPVVRLTPPQEALVDAMMALVRLRAMEQQVSVPTLAPRREVERLLGDDTDAALRHGWRAQLVGHDLQRLLRGELLLRVVDGRLQISQFTP
ncbi:ribonuclease D [Sulfurivermis fontis]|uniref:ribonuclease D n=1 Tax=Sulfurivermis fontis TaxID=1972068 RepID=UPI000FD9527C|nr:ribonuclease D [Sulfurivermis fontis]